MIRNVIFDWSGTLVDDLPAVLEATNHVLQQAGRPTITREQFRAEFRLPFTSFYERHTPEVPLERLERWFHQRFREVQHTVQELPHAREFLEFCRARGLRTLLLSTLHPEHFQVQVKVNGFDRYLDHPYLGVCDKRTRIDEILREHGLKPAETIFIGDMEHDIDTAHAGGVASVGVLTGYNSSAQLRAASPDLIVEHLGELRDVLESGGMTLTRDAAMTRGKRRPVLTVGAAIFDADSKVLMIRTHKWSGRWGIPGGKVEYGEAAEAALVRELKEETGLSIEHVEFAMVQDCIRSPEFYREEHFVLLNYRCRVAGGARSPGVVLNEEAQEWRWVMPAEAMELELNLPTRRLLESLWKAGAAGRDGGAP